MTGPTAAAPAAQQAAAVTDRKALAEVSAQLAARGYELLDTGHGRYIVARWGLSRELDLAGVQRFAVRVGAA